MGGSVTRLGGLSWTDDLTCGSVWGTRSVPSSEPQRWRKLKEGGSPSQVYGRVGPGLAAEQGEDSGEGKDIGAGAVKLVKPHVFQGSRSGVCLVRKLEPH